MTTPDTTNLKTASDVFAATFTLPQIRSIHKSLHTQSEEKSFRLRNKVGSSYRSLLGTADTIVEMKTDADAVQALLVRMGVRTSAAVLKKKMTGLSQYAGVIAAGEKNVEVGETARTRVWEATKGVFSGVLRGSEALGLTGLGRGERLVLATKLLVLRRVLMMSFKGGVPTSAYARRVMSAASKGQESLRNKIGRGIEKALEQVPDVPEEASGAAAGENQDVVLKALAAYSLLTNAGAKDSLQHFLHARGVAMARAFEVDGEEKREVGVENLMRALRLYTATLLDVQFLVPYRIAAELQALKKTRLLEDPSLRKLDVLRLDVYEKWCGDDIQFFTPFIRHDDLDTTTTRTMLFSWAETGVKVLVEGLEKTLSHMNEFKAITDLRTAVLQHWIREGSRAKEIDGDGMLDRLRGVINAQLHHVLDAKVTKIHLVSSEIDSTLSSWVEGDTDVIANLWSPGAFTFDISGGTDSRVRIYISEVLAGINGHNYAVSRALGKYQAWSFIIRDVRDVVELLRRQRWDNDYDEIEAEETIEERQQVLSKDDPQELGDRLTASLEVEFRALEEKLVALWTGKKESPDSGSIAAYLLSVIRGLRGALPDIAAVKGFALRMVPELQKNVVVETCLGPLDTFTMGPLEAWGVVGRGLWEGSEEDSLPTQPSPGAFRLLRNLTEKMGDKGADLWSPVAVRLLKKHVAEVLEEAWVEAVNKAEAMVELEKKGMDIGDEEVKVDDKVDDKVDESDKPEEITEAPEEAVLEETKEDSAAQLRDLFIQWHYDVVYLSLPLSLSPDDVPLKHLQDVLFTKSGLDDSARLKLAKSASDYWKRTHALFGIL